ncbi:MAG: CAP domain-containing protein [Rubrobacteraceae bacterium]
MSRLKIAMIPLVAAVMLAFVAPGVASSDTAYDAEEIEFLDLINEYREQNGAGPLIFSDDLTVASEHHNEDMAEYDFFAHDTVASSRYPVGTQPWDRMSAEGYDYNTYKGENLAVGYDTAEEVFEAWKDSPSHNTAMLDDNYKVVGVSRIQVPDSAFEWYWTTDFGGFVDPTASVEEPEGPEPPRKNLLENGAFGSQDAGWEEWATDGAKLILKGEFARLGGYDDGVDELRQQVRIGDDARLSYDLRITTEESEDFGDRLTVRLTDEEREKVSVLKRYTGEDARPWRRETVDLSRFEGREVYLSFAAGTDEDLHTRFYLDDVRLVG